VPQFPQAERLQLHDLIVTDEVVNRRSYIRGVSAEYRGEARSCSARYLREDDRTSLLAQHQLALQKILGGLRHKHVAICDRKRERKYVKSHFLGGANLLEMVESSHPGVLTAHFVVSVKLYYPVEVTVGIHVNANRRRQNMSCCLVRKWRGSR
jgi:hypothetical protein